MPRPSTELPSQQKPHLVVDTDDIAEKAARAAHFAMQGFGMNQATAMPPQHPVLDQAPQHETPGHVQQHPISGHVPPHHIPGQVQHQLSGQGQHQIPGPAHQQIQGQGPQQMQNQGRQQIPSQPQHFQYHFEHQSAAPQYYQQALFQHNQHLQNPVNQQAINIDPQHHSYAEQNAIPYPTQSAPTQVLYERARMAATAKASPSNRRAGHPSQRRPWTTDEENSLMAGLDRVKGPHWSQILAMFGPGGTINETLKDRNQVQLKDKARNLKLFFLKSGIEVPYYLQFVTGELKTRAPAQAMKNEQRDQSQVVEDRAHVEGIMTLAGGSLPDQDQAVSELEHGAGDMEEGDMSIESIEDDTPNQSSEVLPNNINGDVVPVEGAKQRHFMEQNEVTSRSNGVYANGEPNYTEGFTANQAPPTYNGTAAARVHAIDPV